MNIKFTPKAIEGQEELVKALNKLILEFKSDLYNVHGKPLLVDTPNSTSSTSSAADSTPTPTPTSNASVVNNTNASNALKSTPSIKTSIEDEISFPCPVDQLYLMLTESSRIRAWSRSQANLPQIILPQAPFSLFDGNITGKFLSLTPSSSIEMEWKLKSWESSSMVSINIRPDSDNTASRSILTIKQSNVPAGEAEITKNNWHNYYWNPIKRAFGVIL